MARLILQTAEGQQAIDLRAVNSLGRHPNNTIQLLDKIVSKEHCIIELRTDHFVLRDLGSLNGTFVNNERVRGEAPLRHGDEIALGATRGRFDDGSAPLPPMAPSPSAAPPPPNVAPWGPPQPAPPPPPPQPQAPQGVPPNYPFPFPPPQQANPFPKPAVPQGYPMAPPGFVQPNLAPPSGPHGTGPIPAHAGFQPPPQGAPQQRMGTQAMSFVAQGTRVNVNDQARQIGTQIAAVSRGFLPFDSLARDPVQLRADYERLRLSHELSREIGLERELATLLEKILASIFKFIQADRGVIFLRDEHGELVPRSLQRRDGTSGPISVSSTILSHVVKEKAAVLTHDAAMDFAASKGKSMILNRISSAIVAPLLDSHQNDVLGVIWLDSETLAQFQPKDLDLVSSVANHAAMFIENNLLAKKIESELLTRERFSRLLSPNIAERVISGELEVKPGGQLVEECTVFNSDIRGFTRMSEGTPPEVVVEMLNQYFELMVDTTFKWEGTLDKFMGDGIMALWGAPVCHPDDAVRAVNCALEMGEVLGRYNRVRMERGQAPLAVGIGIHTGPLVAGYIGSSKALSYTVIGDVANTSARLCSVALAGQIIVSEATYQRLRGKFECEELPSAKVKGKEKPLRVYNVIRTVPQVQVPVDLVHEATTST